MSPRIDAWMRRRRHALRARRDKQAPNGRPIKGRVRKKRNAKYIALLRTLGKRLAGDVSERTATS